MEIMARRQTSDDGVCEVVHLNVFNLEINTLIHALEYYTEKHGLSFEARMRAGDMARQIRAVEYKEVRKAD